VRFLKFTSFFPFAFKEKKNCWPTAIKIDVGNGTSIWPFLHKHVEMTLHRLNSYFFYSFTCAVGIVRASPAGELIEELNSKKRPFNFCFFF
jgi:hypothetical protein